MQNITAGSGTAESTSTTSSSGIATDETEELISSSKVEGTVVYNRQGERLGTISNFMVNKRSGQVVYAVMSFGGFLGLGQRCHPLPWKVLTYDTGMGGYVIDLDKDTLRNAPSYAMDQAPTWSQAYGSSIDEYYDRPDRPRDERAIDDAVDDSFPASDPPAWTSETGAGKPREP